MRGALVVLGFVLVMGTGLAVRVGLTMKRTKDRATRASVEIKTTVENSQARHALRRNWANEHEVLSDSTFVGFKHEPQTIGKVTVSCPKCKEL